MSKLLNSFGRTRTFLDNADYVIYRKTTAGSWSFTIPETRMYYIDAVAGGGGGWAVHDHRNNPYDSYLSFGMTGAGSGWSAFGPFYLTKGTVISGSVGSGGASKVSDIAATNLGLHTNNVGNPTTVVIDGTTYTQAAGTAATINKTSSTEYGTRTSAVGSPGNMADGAGSVSVLEGAGAGGTGNGQAMTATNGTAGLIRVRIA